MRAAEPRRKTGGEKVVKIIETNEVYVSELLKTYDILAIQEQWLFSFQLAQLEVTVVTHHVFSKTVDENNPLPPTQKPGGYGGVAILFRTNMDVKIKKLIHRENRIVVIEVQSTPPVCICNVYMPSRNSKGNSKSDDNYQSCLDQIGEVLAIYHMLFWSLEASMHLYVNVKEIYRIKC